MKKRILTLVLALTLVLSLAGCRCKHEWLVATCTAPATCAKCGEVDGEPLGHNWIPATCTTKETCSVCGEMRGDEPQGHTLQEDGSCSVCGEAIGIPLTLENYAQYLTLSISSQDMWATQLGDRDYRPTIVVALSVTPDSNYTYHNVRVNCALTTTNTKYWPNRESIYYNLTESGLFPGDVNIDRGQWQAENPSSWWSCTSESEARQFHHPQYRLSITSVTGYILPVDADVQGN